MQIKFWLEFAAQRLADGLFMLWPRRRPSRQSLLDCRIIAHRGEHDNVRVRENTLAAFDAVRAAGLWGIEFDVRWTRDLEPVVIHDCDTRRVFGVEMTVAEHGLDELRQCVPELPSLAEVVDRFGGNTHMMIELKRDGLGQVGRKRERLRQIFSALDAGADFHILALDFDLFAAVDFAGKRACIPVADLGVAAVSRQALVRGYGGICAHYLLLSKRIIYRHRATGQRVGTGFAASRFCFYRELNRGVDWIFTNRALKLGAIRQGLLRDSN